MNFSSADAWDALEAITQYYSNKNMQEFRPGDKVKLTKQHCECDGVKLNKIYTVQEGLTLFILEEYNSDLYFCPERQCIHPEYWELASPKQRTIEEVQVGDIIMWGNEKSEVLAVIGELVARTDFMGEKEIHWYTKDRLQEEGWKIKQPEPENGAAEKQWLEIGKRNWWNSKCCYGNEDCPKCK